MPSAASPSSSALPNNVSRVLLDRKARLKRAEHQRKLRNARERLAYWQQQLSDARDINSSRRAAQAEKQYRSCDEAVRFHQGQINLIDAQVLPAGSQINQQPATEPN